VTHFNPLSAATAQLTLPVADVLDLSGNQWAFAAIGVWKAIVTTGTIFYIESVTGGVAAMAWVYSGTAAGMRVQGENLANRKLGSNTLWNDTVNDKVFVTVVSCQDNGGNAQLSVASRTGETKAVYADSNFNYSAESSPVSAPHATNPFGFGANALSNCPSAALNIQLVFVLWTWSVAPNIVNLKEAIWDTPELILEGSADFGTVTNIQRHLFGNRHTNLPVVSDGQNAVSNFGGANVSLSFWPGSNNVKSFKNWGMTDTHKHLDLFDALGFPVKTTNYDSGWSGDAQISGSAPNFASWISSNSVKLNLITTGQSVCIDPYTSLNTIPAVDVYHAASYSQCLLALTTGRGEWPIPFYDSNDSDERAQKGNRIGSRFETAAFPFTNGDVHVCGTATNAVCWQALGVGGLSRDTNTTPTRGIVRAGGDVFVGTADGNDESCTFRFKPSDYQSIASGDVIRVYAAFPAYAGGPAAVSVNGEIAAAQNGAATGSPYDTVTPTLALTSVDFTVASHTQSALNASDLPATPDEIVTNAVGTASDFTVSDITAFQANTWDTSINPYIAYDTTNKEFAFITGASFNAGTDVWTLDFEFGFDGDSTGNTIKTGRMSMELLSFDIPVADMVSAGVDYVGFTATKTGASGGGPLVCCAVGCEIITKGGVRPGNIGMGGHEANKWGWYGEGFAWSRFMAAYGEADSFLVSMTLHSGGTSAVEDQFDLLSGVVPTADIVAFNQRIYGNSDTAVTNELSQTRRENFRSVCGTRKIAYTDLVDRRGSFASLVLENSMRDRLHSTARGNYKDLEIVMADMADLAIGGNITPNPYFKLKTPM
jgi:hypothetical protein